MSGTETIFFLKSRETNDDGNDGNSNSDDKGNQSKKRSLEKARRTLYTSHLFAQFAEISWQFCLILFLAAFTNYKSLVLVSTYGLLSGLMVCLTGSATGNFIDAKENNRLFIAQSFIWSQNLCVVLATIFCYLLLDRGTVEEEQPSIDTVTISPSWTGYFLEGVSLDYISLGLLFGIHILGGAARVLDRGFSVAIEKDWIVVMSKLASDIAWESSSGMNESCKQNHQKDWLSETNVLMKQIDLSCKIIAPAVAGFFISFFDTNKESISSRTAESKNEGGSSGVDLRYAALMVGALNVVSLVVEYLCSRQIYDLVPLLAVKSGSKKLQQQTQMSGKAIEEKTLSISDQLVGTTADEELSPESGRASEENNMVQALMIGKDEEFDTSVKLWGYGFFKLPRTLSIYLSQPICFGGFAHALLYLNILTFGAMMTAYLVWRGMSFGQIGIWRGVSSAIGLLGTIAYRYSSRRLSLESTGMWSILLQFTCLSLSYASLFVADLNRSLSMLIIGVCLSRVGLYVFDIAVSQLMQQLIPEDVRGVVGGVQQSLCAFFDSMTFALGIVLPDPRQFHYLVSAGYMSVGVATVCYGFGVFARRDKLRAVP